MATNVLLPLSGASTGRSGVTPSGKTVLRARQKNMKDSVLTPASPGDSSFTGSVTRRGKGEEISRVPLMHKVAKRTVTQEIDPSR